MAETLSPSGIVIPNADGGEAISGTGVAEMRRLGSTTNSALADKASTSEVSAAVEAAKWPRGLLPAGYDTRTLDAPGAYQVTASAPVLHGPDAWAGTSFTLEVIPMGTSWMMHRATNERGVAMTRVRRGQSIGSWTSWDAGTSTGAAARTPLETMGKWTTREQEEAYLASLALHEAATLLDVGRTVEDRPIWGVRLGDPAKPTVLIQCNQHGNEPGSREGAMIFARELAQATSFALFDICVIIIPTVNTDRVLVSRSNANGVNLNRDWETRSQPETQAIAALFSQYNVIAAVDGHSGGYPRDVSVRDAEGPTVRPAVQAQSTRLYEAAMTMYQDYGVSVRRYGGEDASDDISIFRNGVAAIDGIPTLLLEIPSHWNYDPPAPHAPTPYWQAHMAVLCFREVMQIVWHERAEFETAKEGA